MTTGYQYQQELTVQLLPRMMREGPAKLVRTPADVLPIVGGLAEAAQEIGVVLTLNAKNRLTGTHVVSLGIVNATLVHPREVFRRAVIDNASAIIFVHNHPTGDATPSAEDVRMVRQLVEAGRVLDIPVLDAVIIGTDAEGRPMVLSMRESGVVSFST